MQFFAKHARTANELERPNLHMMKHCIANIAFKLHQYDRTECKEFPCTQKFQCIDIKVSFR